MFLVLVGMAVLVATTAGVLLSSWQAVFEETGRWRLVFASPAGLLGVLIVAGVIFALIDPVEYGCSGSALKGLACPTPRPFVAGLHEWAFTVFLYGALFALPVLSIGLLAILFLRKSSPEAK